MTKPALSREAINRRIEELSAKYDSPNDGLRGIRERNAQIAAQRQPNNDQETDT